MMDRKRILLLLAAVALLLVCAACGPASVAAESAEERPKLPPDVSEPPLAGSSASESNRPVSGSPAKGEELMALTDTREEAERIAALYEIELVSWSDSVATFHTEEDPLTVVRRGEANGWPRLDINHVILLDDGPNQ